MSEGSVLQTAALAMRHYRAGWATGGWKPFIELLAPSFEQRVPIGELRGRVSKRDEAVHHLQALRLSGLRLELGEPFRVCAGDRTATFELEVSGSLYDLPYHNRIVISLDVEGGLVTAMREYFGELDPEILARALK